jgi:hypothetical protein
MYSILFETLRKQALCQSAENCQMCKESVEVYKNPVIKEIAKVCHASDIIVREPLREGPQEF